MHRSVPAWRRPDRLSAAGWRQTVIKSHRVFRSVCFYIQINTLTHRHTHFVPMKRELVVWHPTVRVRVCLWFWRETVAAGVVGNVNKCACLRVGEKATCEAANKRLFTAAPCVCLCVCMCLCVHACVCLCVHACVCLCVCEFWLQTKGKKGDHMTRNINTNTHSLSLFHKHTHARTHTRTHTHTQTHTINWFSSVSVNFVQNYCNHYNDF